MDDILTDDTLSILIALLPIHLSLKFALLNARFRALFKQNCRPRYLNIVIGQPCELTFHRLQVRKTNCYCPDYRYHVQLRELHLNSIRLSKVSWHLVLANFAPIFSELRVLTIFDLDESKKGKIKEFSHILTKPYFSSKLVHRFAFK